MIYFCYSDIYKSRSIHLHSPFQFSQKCQKHKINNQDYPCIHLDKERFCFSNCSGVSFSFLIVSSHAFDFPVYGIVAPDPDVTELTQTMNQHFHCFTSGHNFTARPQICGK